MKKAMATLALLPLLAGGAHAADVKANIELFQFMPKEVHAKAGVAIVWTNRDAIEHSVTADDGKTFDTGLFGEGKTATVSVKAKGRYTFHCARHASMTGTLIVE